MNNEVDSIQEVIDTIMRNHQEMLEKIRFIKSVPDRSINVIEEENE